MWSGRTWYTGHESSRCRVFIVRQVAGKGCPHPRCIPRVGDRTMGPQPGSCGTFPRRRHFTLVFYEINIYHIITGTFIIILLINYEEYSVNWHFSYLTR